MSLADALFLVAAIAAVVLGLVCWHLLTRIEQLEAAIQGGLEPPTRRLSSQEFDARFDAALSRQRLGQVVGTGVVLALDPDDATLAKVLANVSRSDGVWLASAGDAPPPQGRFEVVELTSLGVHPPTLPWLWVCDQGVVRASEPVTGPDQLIALLTEHR